MQRLIPLVLLVAGNALAHTGHAAQEGHVHVELWLIGLVVAGVALWFAYRDKP